MKKTSLLLSMFLVAMLGSQAAQAEVRFRAGVSKASYTLGGNYTGAQSEYTAATLGMTLANDRGFYLDMAYTNGSGKHNGWAKANTPTSICGGTACGNTASPSEGFGRQDWQATVGKASLNSETGVAIGLYAGIKGGTTTLNATNAGLAWKWDTLDTLGPVAGLGVSVPVAGGRAGTFGVNGGLGYMGAKWRDSNGFYKEAAYVLGYSYGMSYTYPITAKIGVVADYKANYYNYDFGLVQGKQFSVNESITSLGASLYVKF